MVMCAADMIYFINTFGITYDPRLVTQGQPSYVPFDMFARQEDLVRWFQSRISAAEEGLIEKSRGFGFTWIAAAVAVNKWLFQPGFLTSFGSRKEELVDKIGDSKSIFEKIRLFMYRLPAWMLPPGYMRDRHDNHLKITNPSNGNSITGEAGVNMGRGGRSTLYILDEAAFIDHAESVEAAVSDNADVRIWASTVNGPGNTFAKKRHDGLLRPDQIFTAHWSDDPRRTPEWAKKRQMELSATPWVWHSEYNIDYTAAVEDICIPAAWVAAATRLGVMLKDQLPVLKAEFPGVAGFDIGDGVARSVFQPRYGPVITPCTSWIRPDTVTTALHGVALAKELRIGQVNFDKVGVGKGVLSTMTHSQEDDPELFKDLNLVGVNVGLPASWQTTWPDGQSSRRKFANIKAELWMIGRERFHNSFEHLAFLEGGENGVEHDLDECFLFEPAAPLAEDGYRDPYRELIVQLSTPKKLVNSAGKEIMESKAQLAARGVHSPDFAEGLVLSLYHDYNGAPSRAVLPAIAQVHRGFPELEGGPVMVPQKAAFDPAVRTGTKFDGHFARDW